VSWSLERHWRGRSGRRTFWVGGGALLAGFALLFAALEAGSGHASTLLLYPPFFWLAFVLAARRLHDRGRSARWLLAAAVPLLGPLWLGVELLLRRGTPGPNPWGSEPRNPPRDYLRVA
jgi:uncharacterized membrane protein YhaH (DUF805 family)